MNHAVSMVRESETSEEEVELDISFAKGKECRPAQTKIYVL